MKHPHDQTTGELPGLPARPKQRGPKPKGGQALTNAERQAALRQRRKDAGLSGSTERSKTLRFIISVISNDYLTASGGASFLRGALTLAHELGHITADEMIRADEWRAARVDWQAEKHVTGNMFPDNEIANLVDA